MELEIFFDGSFSSDQSGAGVVVKRDGRKLYDVAVNVGTKSNSSMAELSALSVAIDEAAKLRRTYKDATVTLMGDCQSVIAKVNALLHGPASDYSVVIAKMMGLGLDNCSLNWVGREQNPADRYSKIGRKRRCAAPSVFHAHAV